MALEFTTRQQELMVKYMMCMRTKPDVDMEKFAKIAGFANVNSARANTHKILQKIFAARDDADASESNENGANGNAGSPKKKVARKRKGKDDSDEAEEPEPKKKRGRTAKKSAEKIKEEAPNDDNDGEMGAADDGY